MSSSPAMDGGDPPVEICGQLFRQSCQLGEALWLERAAKAGVPAHDLSPAERPDGRAAWRTWKALADTFCPATGEWSAGFGEKVAEGGELSGLLAVLEGRGRTEGAHPFHFAAQILRIPKKEPCSFCRFLQVGFDLGQLTGSGGIYQVGPEFIEAYLCHQFDNPRLYVENFAPFQAHASGLERIRAAAGCALREYAHLAAPPRAGRAPHPAEPSAEAPAPAPQDGAPAAGEGEASGPLAGA